MADDKKVHPMRRKHRRGKRAGKRNRPAPAVALVLAPSPPTVVLALRKRLSLLSHRSPPHAA